MQLRYDLSGSQVHSAREYDIAATTAIKYGQVVKVTDGLVVAAVAAETGAILGVAAEEHSGASSDFNTRSNGEKIKVFDSPEAVFACPAPVITVTAGSTTTIAASGMAAFSDDDLNGGYVKLVGKAASSTNPDPIGKVRRITDFTATGKIIALDATLSAAPAEGDTYELYPPFGFGKGNLDSNKVKLVVDATAALPLKVIGRNDETGEIELMASLHLLGNKKA